jgi:hypothetical protein
MQLSINHFRRGLKRKTGFYRLVFWFALIILTLQLIGMTHHNHSLAENDRDCVSCYLSVHVPTTIPPVTIDLVPTQLVLLYWIPSLPIYNFVVATSYLIPLALAPPHRLISA